MTTSSIDEFRTRARPAPRSDRINDLRGMAQELPRAAALTGDPNWDLYLRHVEASIKATERMIEQKRDQAAALVLVDETKAKHAAVLVAALSAKAETLRELILLPKWIIENGKEAAKLVAEMEASVA